MSCQLKYIISIACWVIGIGALLMGQSSVYRGRYFLVTIGGVIGGVLFWHFAQHHYEIEKEELEAQTDIERQRNALRTEQIRTQQIDNEARMNIGLVDAQRNTALKSETVNQRALDTAQRELELRDELIAMGKQKGIQAQDVAEVNKKQYLNEVDLQHDLRKMQEQVRLAIIAKHLDEVQKIALIQENIDGIIKQIDQIENDPTLSEKTKQRLIEDREDILATLKEDRRGRQKRLLEAHNGGDVRGDDEDTDI